MPRGSDRQDQTGASSSSSSSQDSISTFRSVIEALPDEYQAQFRLCTTGDTVLESIKDYGATWNTRKRRLGVFIQAMKPFFAAMDVFVQCDPMHAATFWGALRVVIALGINFNDFLDKVTSGLEGLASEISYFADLHQLVLKMEVSRQKQVDEAINKELWKRNKEGWTTQMLEELKKKLREERSDAMHATVRRDLESLVKSSPRLSRLLQDTFEEIVQFLMGVFRIFYHPDGRSKNAMRVVAKTIWKPFRFDETLSRVERYREKLGLEVSLLNLKLANLAKGLAEANGIEAMEERIQAKERGEKVEKALTRVEGLIEKEAQYTFIHRARQWLDPPSFADRFDDVASQCAEGTTGWLRDHTSFIAWSRDQSNSTGRHLWVRGNPGSGKSVLAASVIQELRETQAQEPVCYYFFNATQTTIPNRSYMAYRALLSQILQYKANDDQFKAILEFAMYFQSAGQLTASTKEVDELLELCLHSGHRIYLVFDGLDECDDWQQLVEKLRRLAHLQSTRLALFYRPTMTNLPRRVPSLETLTIGSLNMDDIHLYLHRELTDMAHEGLLANNLDPEIAARSLTRRADGMFLWARLMITYLNSPALYPAERTNAITDLDRPEGLDVMYERILRLIERGGKAMQRLAGGSFLWLSYDRRPLIPAELECGLIPLDVKPNDEEAWKLPDFEDVVVRACGGFVELSPRPIRFLGKIFRPLRFIHASVKEYFASQPLQWGSGSESALANGIVPPPPIMAHAQLATICLKYLTYRVPAQPLSGTLEKDAAAVSLWAAFPFSNYAMLEWACHLKLTDQEPAGDRKHYEIDQLLLTLKQFFAQPKVLMAWIEGCYTYGEPPKANCLQTWGQREILSSDLESSQVVELRKTALDFGNYLRTLNEDWAENLHKSPECIWEEITAFTPSPLLPNHAGFAIRSLQTSQTTRNGIAKQPINRLTQVAPDGAHHVVLSVFTSEEFERYSPVTPADKFCKYRSISRGWIVSYKINQLDSLQTVVSLDIPLPESDVWERLYETLFCGFVQIPISMSQDCYSFAVMKILYRVRREGKELVYTSHHLPDEPIPRIFSRKVNDSRRKYEKSPEELTFKDSNRFGSDELQHVLLYWIYFDDRGEHLCYATQERAAPACLRVFKVDVYARDKLRVETTQIAQRQFWPPYKNRDEKKFELCFHPSLPIIVYTWARGTYVWNFLSNVAVKAGYGSDEVVFLSCSKTGDSCILTAKGYRPEIIPIESAIEDTGICRLKQREGSDDADGQGAEVSEPEPEPGPNLGVIPTHPTGKQLHTTQAWTLAHAILEKGKLLTSSNVIRGPNGTLRHVSVLNSGRSASLHVWNDAGGDASLNLTRLPNWEGAESARATIIGPSGDNSNVQIILDKTADTWSRVSKRAPIAFPLAVERSARSFTRQAASRTQASIVDDEPRCRKVRQGEQEDTD